MVIQTKSKKEERVHIAIAYDRKGNVLAIGKNKYDKTHPEQARFASKTDNPHRIYLHAEIDALIKAKKQVYKMHIIRIRSSGEYGLSKPCAVCELALKHYGVKVVTHTFNKTD